MSSNGPKVGDVAEQDLAVLRRRIHAAIDGDLHVVARLMATWARHVDVPSPGAEQISMPCPFPGHEDSQMSCSVFRPTGSPVVRFACSVCGSDGDVVTAHQLIFGSDIRQAMRAVWVALAGTLWQVSLDPSPVGQPHSITAIVDATATVCGVPAETILGFSRKQHHVEARYLAMFVARTTTDLSYPEIARAFSGRDHTSVMHGVRRIEQLVTESEDVRAKLHKIEAWMQQPVDTDESLTTSRSQPS